MSIALGLDAGGTYTDAVLYDLATDTLLASAKSPTTPPTYIDGVRGAVAGLPEGLRSEAAYVAISTTLATNAIVEGRHAPAGLILIGYDQFDMAKIAWEKKLAVSGKHDIRGIEETPFDETGFRNALQELVSEGISGLAISSVMSVRNPEHEQRAAEIARNETDIPVVEGRTVTSVLNSLVRAETAALNAGLIPLVHRFISAVESVLSELALENVPCMMVTGDGSLVSTDVARERPVETILSGPACSALGAGRLAGAETGVVVDIGGTTTDIAVLQNNAPCMSETGVTVGQWKAGVASARVLTRGLGGDSCIEVHPKFSVGPRRAVPISRLGTETDSIRESFQKTFDQFSRWGRVGGDWRLTNPTDTYVLLHNDAPAPLQDSEKAVVEALESGPLTRSDLSKAAGYEYMSLLSTSRLEAWGMVQRGGLTPTDLWHVTGEFSQWDTDTARIAAELTALRLGVSVEELITMVRRTATDALTRQVTQGYLGLDGDAHGDSSDTVAGQLMRIVLGETPGNGLRGSLKLVPPIIGVGAPARLFLEESSTRLGGKLIVPHGAEVANAVGAATGLVIVSAEALVRPEGEGGVVCYTPENRAEFETRKEAQEHAVAELVPYIQKEMQKRGASASDVEIVVEHNGIQVQDVHEPVWWESKLLAHGTGRPSGASADSAPTDMDDVVITERWDPPRLAEIEEEN